MEIRNITVKSSVEEGMQQGNLEVFVQAAGEKEKDHPVFLWAQLADEEGLEADRIFPIELEEENSFCMQVNPVRLWNMEQPQMYDLILELRDENNRLLGTSVKKTAFFLLSGEENKLCMNGKKITVYPDPESGRVEELLQKNGTEEKIKEQLRRIRCAGRNALVLPKMYWAETVVQWCLEYGILLVEKAQESLVRPDFAIQVVEDGALIENHSIFTDLSEYDLYCEIEQEGTILQKSIVRAEAVPGSSRYLELPFIRPSKPGIYCYRVSVCLRKDQPWAKKGSAVAMGEAIITNLWMG